MRFRTYGHIDFKFYDDKGWSAGPQRSEAHNVDENKRRKKRVPENIH